jgi:hypothetical protein
MINPTKIKDGLVLVFVLGVGLIGFFVAKKILNIGGELVDGTVQITKDFVEPLTPKIDVINPSETKSKEQADWENMQIELMAMGGLGA